MWRLNRVFGGSMEVYQAVKPAVPGSNPASLQPAEQCYSLLGSQQGWHDNCRLSSEGRQRQTKYKNTKKIIIRKKSKLCQVRCIFVTYIYVAYMYIDLHLLYQFLPGSARFLCGEISFYYLSHTYFSDLSSYQETEITWQNMFRNKKKCKI